MGWIIGGAIAGGVLLLFLSVLVVLGEVEWPVGAPPPVQPTAPAPSSPQAPLPTPPAEAMPPMPVPTLASEFGEGSWTVGEDVRPGTYKVSEPITSGSCYWEITKGDTDGKIEKHGVEVGGRPKVTLVKGQTFRSSGCGIWIKVG